MNFKNMDAIGIGIAPEINQKFQDVLATSVTSLQNCQNAATILFHNTDNQ